MSFPLFKAEICSEKSQNTIRLLQNLLEPFYPCILKISLLSELFKSFIGIPLSAASQAQPDPEDNGATIKGYVN